MFVCVLLRRPISTSYSSSKVVGALRGSLHQRRRCENALLSIRTGALLMLPSRFRGGSSELCIRNALALTSPSSRQPARRSSRCTSLTGVFYIYSELCNGLRWRFSRTVVQSAKRCVTLSAMLRGSNRPSTWFVESRAAAASTAGFRTPRTWPTWTTLGCSSTARPVRS